MYTKQVLATDEPRPATARRALPGSVDGEPGEARAPELETAGGSEAVATMQRRIRIVATGSYVPRRVVPSSEIDHRLGKKTGWTERVFRIAKRHYADENETSSFMAAAAAMQALERANLSAHDVDAVIAACGVGEQPIPATAVLVQHRLGLATTDIAAFDINATCLSFVAALDMVADAITVGRYKRVLIVSADIASCGLDWSNPEAAAIFGDGAAAAIVEAASEADGPRILASAMNTYSAFKDSCRLEAGGTSINATRGTDRFDDATTFKMDGHEAMACVAANLPRFVVNLCQRAGTTVDGLDLAILHQASARSLSAVQQLVGFDAEKFFLIFRDFGNQIAASIPHALDHAIASGRLKRGQKVMLLGSSAGISLGGMILEY